MINRTKKTGVYRSTLTDFINYSEKHFPRFGSEADRENVRFVEVAKQSIFLSSIVFRALFNLGLSANECNQCKTFSVIDSPSAACR